MLNILKFNTEKELNDHLTREEFIEFLHKHLDRFGDDKKAISKSIDYAFGKDNAQGGFLLAAYYEDNLVGALVMNKTGMGGYIPDYVLVYVAVDGSYRNKGFGKKIVNEGIAHCDGDVKLHVEYDNPAKRLYERIGFTNKYAEMRFSKEEK